MREQLKSGGVSSFELGPFHVRGTDSGPLIGSIYSDLVEAAYLDRSVSLPEELDFTAFWEWAATKIASTKQIFLVTVDVGDSGNLRPSNIASHFSNARKLETCLFGTGLRVYTVFEGFWNPFLLDAYYKELGISFPYTPAYNYAEWQGIDEKQTAQLVSHMYPNARPIIGRLLHEIADGNPAIIMGILGEVQEENFNYEGIIDATREYARCGSLSLELVDIWMSLPPKAKETLATIILRRRALGLVSSDMKRLLSCFGLTKLVYIQNQEYLCLRSWFVELLLVIHRERLGLSEHILERIDMTEIMPELTTINTEAYQLIHDIETQVRNFVVQQRYRLIYPSLEDDILDVDIKIRGTKSENVARETAKWKSRSERKGVMVNVNPRISYSSTGQLCGLLESIAFELHSNEWLEIASNLDEMKDIRDAVMHNQIINDIHLERLYELQAHVYRALNQV